MIKSSMFSTTLKRAVAISSIALLAACGSDSDETSPLPEGFAFEAGIEAKFYADETYGTDTRNKFDIFLPESTEPTPLIIYIHGGGFFAGDKSAAYSNAYTEGSDLATADINDVLEAGVAYATINYSLIDVPGFNDAVANDTEGLNKSLSDIKEALQYIRLNAEEYNIDPTKIATYGVSAGAVSSLWLAYSDDMADSEAAEGTLASQSTRIVAAGAIETQASLNLLTWNSVLSDFTDGTGMDALQTAAAIGAGPFMESAYGLVDDSESQYANTFANIYAPSAEDEAYRLTLDIPAQIDNSDPAVFVSNVGVSLTETAVASARLAEVQVEGPAALAEFHSLSLNGDVEAASAKYIEAISLQTEGVALAGEMINALLHAPQHASTIMATAMAQGAEVVANIPQLEPLMDPNIVALMNPADLTVIPFLLAELEAQ